MITRYSFFFSRMLEKGFFKIWSRRHRRVIFFPNGARNQTQGLPWVCPASALCHWVYHHPDLWMNFRWEERDSASFTIIEKQKDPNRWCLSHLWVDREGAGKGTGAKCASYPPCAAANCPLWRRALEHLSAFPMSLDLAVLPPRIYFVATLPCIWKDQCTKYFSSPYLYL